MRARLGRFGAAVVCAATSTALLVGPASTAYAGEGASTTTTTTQVTAPPAPSAPSAPTGASGYRVVLSGGVVRSYGTTVLADAVPVVSYVAATATPTGSGARLTTATGQVTSVGDAAAVANGATPRLNKPIVDITATPSGLGYWLVASDGGIFAYGDARFFGSTGAMRLNKPIVGMASTASGLGYWLVASDGGIFAYGDARFLGSTGAMRLNKPIVGMASTASGLGYWLVASDGGIFAYGDARFFGSTGAIRLNKPIVGMSPSGSGGGYRMLAADGGIFAFGDARFYGSPATATTQAIALLPSGPDTPATLAVRFAFSHIGDPYQWGGSGPNTWDCSGLVQAAYKTVGITIPRTSETQWAQVPPVAKGQSIQPGDLLFFGTPDDASHVGIAIGNGQMIHAPYTGANVQIASVSRSDYLGAARPAP